MEKLSLKIGQGKTSPEVSLITTQKAFFQVKKSETEAGVYYLTWLEIQKWLKQYIQWENEEETNWFLQLYNTSSELILTSVEMCQMTVISHDTKINNVLRNPFNLLKWTTQYTPTATI